MFPGNPLLRLAGLAGLPAPPEGTVPVEAPPEYVRATLPSSFGPIAAAQADVAASAQPPRRGGIGHAIGSAFETMLGMKHAANVRRIEQNQRTAELFAAEAMKPGAPPEVLEAALHFGKAAGWDNEAISQTKKLYQQLQDAQVKFQDSQRRQNLLPQQNQGQAPMPQAALSPGLRSPFFQPPQPAAPVQTVPQAGPVQPPGAPAAVPPAIPGIPQGNFQNPALIQNIMQRTLPKPPIPFSQGAVSGTTPAPMPTDKVQGIEQSAASTGAGFGGASTAPMDLPEVPDPAMRGNLFNYGPQAEGRRLAAVDVAKARVLNQYAAEYGVQQIYNSLARLSIMGINPKDLSPSQLATYIEKGSIPELAFHDVKEGDLSFAIGPDSKPKVIYGQPKPQTVAPGGKAIFPALPGGAVPGAMVDISSPTALPAGAGAGGTGASAGAGTDVGTALPPGAPGSVVEGGPLLTRAQQAANAAWEANHHGQKITPDRYAEALSAFTESSMSPTQKRLRDAQILSAATMQQMRQLEQQKLNQTILEFKQTKGPEAIESLTDQVYQNPDLYQSLAGDVRNLVAQRFSAKYHLPAPRAVPADLKAKEDASIISLNHVLALRELMKNEVLKRRMGAWNGRLGNLEQAIGTTAGLSDADARAIQDFRTRTKYLFGQESKAVFGARGAKQFMEDLKQSSPNMSMGLPLFQGALDAVQGMGQLNLKSAEDYRYNIKPGVTGGLTLPPGRIKIKVKANGATGSIDEADFDPQTMERIK